MKDIKQYPNQELPTKIASDADSNIIDDAIPKVRLQLYGAPARDLLVLISCTLATLLTLLVDVQLLSGTLGDAYFSPLSSGLSGLSKLTPLAMMVVAGIVLKINRNSKATRRLISWVSPIAFTCVTALAALYAFTMASAAFAGTGYEWGATGMGALETALAAVVNDLGWPMSQLAFSVASGGILFCSLFVFLQLSEWGGGAGWRLITMREQRREAKKAIQVLRTNTLDYHSGSAERNREIGTPRSERQRRLAAAMYSRCVRRVAELDAQYPDDRLDDDLAQSTQPEWGGLFGPHDSEAAKLRRRRFKKSVDFDAILHAISKE